MLTSYLHTFLGNLGCFGGGGLVSVWLCGGCLVAVARVQFGYEVVVVPLFQFGYEVVVVALFQFGYEVVMLFEGDFEG